MFMATSHRTLKEKAYQEMKEFVVMALYLWLVFGLFIVYKSVVLAEYHIDFAANGIALINALALAKVMLLAKGLHLGEQFNDRPLIYPTLVKSAMFAVVLACFKILEEFAIGLYHHKSFRESMAHLAGGTGKGIVAFTVILFVILIPFVGFGELQRVFGEGKLAHIFFHRGRAEGQSTASVLS
jgi:hypothetical protein